MQGQQTRRGRLSGGRRTPLLELVDAKSPEPFPWYHRAVPIRRDRAAIARVRRQYGCR